MLVDWDNVQELSDFWRDGMKLGPFYNMPDLSRFGRDSKLSLADKTDDVEEEQQEEEQQKKEL